MKAIRYLVNVRSRSKTSDLGFYGWCITFGAVHCIQYCRYSKMETSWRIYICVCTQDGKRSWPKQKVWLEFLPYVPLERSKCKHILYQQWKFCNYLNLSFCHLFCNKGLSEDIKYLSPFIQSCFVFCSRTL